MNSKEHHKHVKIYHKRTTNCRLSFYQRQINQLFDEMIHDAWGKEEYEPEVDVLETSEHYKIEMDLPGVLDEDLKILHNEHRIVIEGNRRISRGSKHYVNIHVCERSEGHFARVFEFEHEIDPGKIERKQENGVLILILKKVK